MTSNYGTEKHTAVNAADTETDREQLAAAEDHKVNPNSSSLLFLTRCQNMVEKRQAIQKLW